MDTQPKIPRIPHAFFKWYCRHNRYEELHGDLEELYYERVKNIGLTRAKLAYLWDVIRCCQPYAWKKPKLQTNHNIAMFRNFYFTAIRNFIKFKSYFLINVTGLAIGISSFIFISLYLVNELSYDRFHPDYQNIYRVSNRALINGIPNKQATTSMPMVETLKNKYPEVKTGTRISESEPLLIGRGDKKIFEEGVLYADSTFFEVFDFKLIKGDPHRALVAPKSMILSERYSQKYFGSQNPMGQQITVDGDTNIYTITGVMEDIPGNSHLQFDMLGSMSSDRAWSENRWIGREVHAYVILPAEVNIEAFEEKIHEIFYEHLAPEIEYFTGETIADWEKAGDGNSIHFELVPVADIHLHSDYSRELEAGGNISYIYIYAVIGAMILFIAIFNYVNMATAQASTRSKEVGLRKVMGSNKASLIQQFLLESLIVSTTATLLAGMMVSYLSPVFMDLIGKPLAYGIFSSYLGPLLLLGLALWVGCLAGFYPAFILASFKPVQALKGGRALSQTKSGWLRNSLVVAQFTASIVIIIGTLVVYYQINYMLTKNLGFDKEQIVVLRHPGALERNLDAFKNDLLLHPNVTTVVNSQTLPGKSYAIRSYRPKDNPETFLFSSNLVGYNYQEVLGLELLSGRFFSEEYGTDTSAVVINEAAAKAFGFDKPIGQRLYSPWHMGEYLSIIGVIKNYHVASLHRQIAPVALELIPDKREGYISVRLHQGQNIPETVQFLEDTWHQHVAGDQPFQYFFFDEEYQRLYQSETTTGKVFIIFALLSIFIACLGLVGLISYTLSRRKKEIGIRKVLGANLRNLVWLLSSDFVRLILLATLVAWPLAYFATNYWLENFAERISLNPWMYLGATILVVLIGSFSISFQTIKASRRNPVESLRQE